MQYWMLAVGCLLLLVSSVSNFPFILLVCCDANSLKSAPFMWFVSVLRFWCKGLNDSEH